MFCSNMKTNESDVDRIVRMVVGVSLLITGFYYLSGLSQAVVFVIAIIALLTGIIGHCCIYDLMGMSTLPAAPKAKRVVKTVKKSKKSKKSKK